MYMYTISPIPSSQGWACVPSAFHSEFYSNMYMCRLVALFMYISKPLRLLQMYIFLSH